MGTPPARIRQQLASMASPQEAAYLQSETQQEVTLPEAYYLSATEVTVGQFRRFIEATGHVTLAERAARDQEGGWGWHPQDGWRRQRGCSWRHMDQLALSDNHPAGNITWSDAQAFCRWMTGATGHVCRLPTEAEWEFACRAGSAGLWCFGDDEAKLPIFAWTDDLSGGVFHPVARKRANAMGLFDMHGNLGEWCAGSAGAERPMLEPDFQPVRGGHFLSTLDRTRSAARRWEHGNTFGPGFRVMQEVSVGRS
jgi:formylglycine-generating enzyme required for sulfatase activity